MQTSTDTMVKLLIIVFPVTLGKLAFPSDLLNRTVVTSTPNSQTHTRTPHCPPPSPLTSTLAEQIFKLNNQPKKTATLVYICMNPFNPAAVRSSVIKTQGLDFNKEQRQMEVLSQNCHQLKTFSTKR